MPDGATTFIAPNRDHAESFWASFTGDKATPIRLRFIYEGGDDRLPRNEQGEFLDPATRNVLPVDPKSGKHRKPKVWEVEGTLDQLWPRVTELQGHAYAAFYFPNRI